MQVTVIGATGHIGTWLIPRLVRAGHDVIAVSRGDRQPYHRSREWGAVRNVSIDRQAAELDGSFGTTIAALRSDAVIDLICFGIDSATQIVDALRGRIEIFAHCG